MTAAPALIAATRLAGLLHDVGKATERFQFKLRANLRGADAVRHELVSFLALDAMAGHDSDVVWLRRLAANPGPVLELALRQGCERARDIAGGRQRGNVRLALEEDGRPVRHAVGWMVLAHHRPPAEVRWQQRDAAGRVQERVGWSVAAHLGASRVCAGFWPARCAEPLAGDTEWMPAIALSAATCLSLAPQEHIDVATGLRMLMRADAIVTCSPPGFRGRVVADRLHANTVQDWVSGQTGRLHQTLGQHSIQVADLAVRLLDQDDVDVPSGTGPCSSSLTSLGGNERHERFNAMER